MRELKSVSFPLSCAKKKIEIQNFITHTFLKFYKNKFNLQTTKKYIIILPFYVYVSAVILAEKYEDFGGNKVSK